MPRLDFSEAHVIRTVQTTTHNAVTLLTLSMLRLCIGQSLSTQVARAFHCCCCPQTGYGEASTVPCMQTDVTAMINTLAEAMSQAEKNTGCLCSSIIFQHYIMSLGMSMPSQASFRIFPSSHNRLAANL